MCVLCLIVGKDRKVQAEQCFREALRMGLREIDILEEIGDLYMKDIQLDLAILAYSQIVAIDSKYGEGW